MSPDENSRISRLEVSMATVQSEQAEMRSEIKSLRNLIQTLTPLNERTAVTMERVGSIEQNLRRVESELKEDMREFKENWGRLQHALEVDRDARQSAQITSLKEAAKYRRAIVAGMGSLCVLVVACAGVILQAVS